MRRPEEYVAAAEFELETAAMAVDNERMGREVTDRIVDFRHGRALVLAELAHAAALLEVAGRPAEKIELVEEVLRERYGVDS